MHNVFHVPLIEQDTTRKERVDERLTELEFEAGNSEEYKVEAIWDNAIYISKLELGQLLGLYYLIAWKRYPKEENTWEPSSAIQHLKKLINSIYKDHQKKPTVTSPPIHFGLLMADQQSGLPSLNESKADWLAVLANEQRTKF